MKGQLKEVRTKEDAQRASSLLISDFLTGQGRAFYTLFDIKPFKKQAFHRGFRQREKAAYDPFRGRRERVQLADLPRRAYRSGREVLDLPDAWAVAIRVNGCRYEASRLEGVRRLLRPHEMDSCSSFFLFSRSAQTVQSGLDSQPLFLCLERMKQRLEQAGLSDGELPDRTGKGGV